MSTNPFKAIKQYQKTLQAQAKQAQSQQQEVDDQDDMALFQDAMKGIKKLQQDTIIRDPKQDFAQAERKNKQQTRKTLREASDNEFYFSDEFEPLLSEDGPTRYARSDVSKYEVKRLRRGVYTPDVYLDLHGMTQQQAKQELGAMIAYCLKEGIHCASVMHGIGKHILKQKVPLWLAQHPDVLAYHQAPLEFGGNGALLVLLSVPEK